MQFRITNTCLKKLVWKNSVLNKSGWFFQHIENLKKIIFWYSIRNWCIIFCNFHKILLSSTCCFFPKRDFLYWIETDSRLFWTINSQFVIKFTFLLSSKKEKKVITPGRIRFGGRKLNLRRADFPSPNYLPKTPKCANVNNSKWVW